MVSLVLSLAFPFLSMEWLFTFLCSPCYLCHMAITFSQDCLLCIIKIYGKYFIKFTMYFLILESFFNLENFNFQVLYV